MNTNVDYKFYRTPDGSYAVLPGANIAPGSGLQEVSYQDFKTGAQSRLQGGQYVYENGNLVLRGTTGSYYDKLLNGTDSGVSNAIRAAEAGQSVSAGQLNNGTFSTNASINQEAANQAAVKAGTMKQSVVNGVNVYSPINAAPFVQGSVGQDPGMVRLPPGVAPTNAGGINTGVNNPNIPSSTYPTGNISNVNGTISGISTGIDGIIKSRQDQIKAEQDALKNTTAGQGEQTFLQKLLGQKSPDQVRAEAISKTGVDPSQYFIDEKAKIAEIEALTEEYNKVKAEKDAQIAASGDKMASNNFINNQTAQIERNAAPKLLELSANVNAKTATLAAQRGMFAEAQQFVNQAVQDATAMQKYNYDMYSLFKDENEAEFKKLDKPYEDAYNLSMDIAKMQYQKALSSAEEVGKLLITPDGIAAGVKITDSIEQAYQKISNLGTKSPTYLQAQADINAKNRTNTSSGGGTLAERQTAILSQYDFPKGALVPGTNGVPVYDSSGYLTPEAWNAAIVDAANKGISREAFIKAKGYVLPVFNGELNSKFNLTKPEVKLITGQ